MGEDVPNGKNSVTLRILSLPATLANLGKQKNLLESFWVAHKIRKKANPASLSKDR